MSTKSKIILALIFSCIGFMIAIQFQSIQEPKERDTRDMWEIRTQLQAEQETQQELYQQLDELETTLQEYKDNAEQDQINTLMESVEVLKMEAGLTDKTGRGITITINPVFEESNEEQVYPSVTPELLNRLINELNNYGATDIAIGNERYIGVTPIRNVNGETYVNNRALPDIPFVIKVLSNEPERLLDYMEVSQSKDDFSIENMEFDINVEDTVTLPSYDGNIDLEIVELDETNEAGEE
ncbi:DUF881 domain-containing protein [Paraliobacillus sp. X-1268]|uniref:DUF881 domain-containing protein n=1 Tax=Paraliobacillus sp. X-1268 TaxID=2213193 RepID=UPI0013008185|nr:DUF881 domain-containing protein [Paraliobacillus sp. X-1268]